MKIRGKIILKKGKETSARRFHPWIFSGAVHAIEGNPEEGSWVEVVEASGVVIGYGHYQKGTITVRIISFSQSAPSDSFYSNVIQEAYQERLMSGVISNDTNCFRLVNAEGDGLPGLIIDFYDNVLVMQAHSAGMHSDRHLLAKALNEGLAVKPTAIYYKSQGTLPGKPENGYLEGLAAVPHTVLEHGNKFAIDWEEGQKTGFFLDQRENRKYLGELSSGKKVLNTFCYTGGFSVYALRAGATLVHSVDASEKAIALTRKNIELNGFDNSVHESFVADTFDFLKERKAAYDVIILDPPAFAKHKDAKHQAMKGYQRLNAEAIRLIKPGGIIFTFSCSQVVDRQLFYNTIVSSAILAERKVRVLRHLSHPADHPVSIYHPEGEYLKGLVLHVS